jgi:hypothetical protein
MNSLDSWVEYDFTNPKYMRPRKKGDATVTRFRRQYDAYLYRVQTGQEYDSYVARTKVGNVEKYIR